MSPRSHIGTNEFVKINWLPTKNRVEQCLALKVYKYFKRIAPSYVNDIFLRSQNSYNTRRSQTALDIPLKKTNTGQKSISYLGPSLWNKLDSHLRVAPTTIAFTHNYKKHILKDLQI